MGVLKSNTATGKLYTQEHIRFCEAILPPFMALIVSLSYNTHRKRERHGKVLLLGSLIRIDQLQSQGAFPDSFFIWTLSDLLTFRASLTKPQWLHLNCMQCCAPSPHLLLPGSKGKAAATTATFPFISTSLLPYNSSCLCLRSSDPSSLS